MGQSDPADEDSELSRHLVLGEFPASSGSNLKHETHNHYGNGSQKIVWAWAAFATGLVCAVIGGVAMYFASQQSTTNQNVANAITNQSVSIAELKATVAGLQRTVDRIERTVDQRQ